MKLLHAFGVVALTVLSAATMPAVAAGWPDHPIRLVVGFPPGGGADFVARQVASNLAQALGQTVVVDNRAGANGIIAATEVAHQKPDGYTLLLGVSASHSINPNLYPKLPYDPVKDFTAISEVGFTPLVLVVDPTLPVQSVPDFVRWVKASAQPVAYASAGIGNVTHLAAELFSSSAGLTNLTHVPYKGSAPAIIDLMGGRVTAYFDTMPSSMPFIRSGQLKPLGVTSAKRASALPELKTIAEQGLPGYDVSNWFGVFGPANLPGDVTQQIAGALKRSFSTPEMRKTMLDQGVETVLSTPSEFDAMLCDDLARWHEVTTNAHIVLER